MWRSHGDFKYLLELFMDVHVVIKVGTHIFGE